MGPLPLGSLAPGKWRELTQREVRELNVHIASQPGKQSKPGKRGKR
jgi:16S rRNA U516 pseudouridylate synthase RsuA-like enzyme